MAADAKRAGRLDEHSRLVKEIETFDANCKHRRHALAECGEIPGDHLQICVSCGKILSRIPSDLPSGVRIRA